MKNGYINVRASEKTMASLKELAEEKKLSQGQLLEKLIETENNKHGTVNIYGSRIIFTITVTRNGQEDILSQTDDPDKAINVFTEYSWNFRSKIIEGTAIIQMRSEWTPNKN